MTDNCCRKVDAYCRASSLVWLTEARLGSWSPWAERDNGGAPAECQILSSLIDFPRLMAFRWELELVGDWAECWTSLARGLRLIKQLGKVSKFLPLAPPWWSCFFEVLQRSDDLYRSSRNCWAFSLEGDFEGPPATGLPWFVTTSTLITLRLSQGRHWSCWLGRVGMIFAADGIFAVNDLLK